jgi:hypothetical protein
LGKGKEKSTKPVLPPPPPEAIIAIAGYHRPQGAYGKLYNQSSTSNNNSICKANPIYQIKTAYRTE